VRTNSDSRRARLRVQVSTISVCLDCTYISERLQLICDASRMATKTVITNVTFFVTYSVFKEEGYSSILDYSFCKDDNLDFLNDFRVRDIRHLENFCRSS
jgi:hypothetical protein